MVNTIQIFNISINNHQYSNRFLYSGAYYHIGVFSHYHITFAGLKKAGQSKVNSFILT